MVCEACRDSELATIVRCSKLHLAAEDRVLLVAWSRVLTDVFDLFGPTIAGLGPVVKHYSGHQKIQIATIPFIDQCQCK